MIYFVLILVAAYILAVFVLSRMFVPFMGWSGFKPPRAVPEEIKAAVADLEIRAHDQLSYLEATYGLLMDKNGHQWKHSRFNAAVHIPRAFVSNLSELWQTHEFIYCTGMNYLAATLLTGSKYFKWEDIKVKHVFVNFFIHQYIQVRVGDGWVDFDPAGTGIRGKPLGTHLVWFG